MSNTNNQPVVGNAYPTKQGDELVVLSIADKKRYVWVTFKHKNTPQTYKQLARYDHVLSGNVKNPYYPSVFGKGYLGEAYGKVPGRSTLYRTWKGMLERCYCPKLKQKYPTYEDVTCIEAWLNLATFKKWFDLNYVENFQLDKDILVKNNKEYNPDTVCFIPASLNKLLTKANAIRGNLPIGVQNSRVAGQYIVQLNNGEGEILNVGSFNTVKLAFEAYKTEKEVIIRQLADLNFERGLITEKVKTALYQYQVEIND